MPENLTDILFFSEVARAGSITAAARRLATPKSTISRRLIRFEERIGSKLFYKTTRKIVLTELGEDYFERCERIVRDVEDAQLFLEAALNKPRGALRVTMPADFGIYWMGDFLAGFSRRHPSVSIELDFTARRVDLIGERYDVAIRAGALTSSALVARKFVALRRALYASPAYLAEAGAPKDPAAIEAHRFVLLEAHARPSPRLKLFKGRNFRDIGISGPIVSNSLGMVRALVSAGSGLGELPVRMCAQEEQAGGLIRVLPDWAPAPLDCYYLVPARRLLPAKTRVFVDALVDHFGKRGAAN